MDKIKLKNLAKKWAEGEAESDLPSNDIVTWHEPVLAAMSVGDIEGMREAAAPKAQWNVIRLLDNDDAEIRYKASIALLAQCGHGAITKVETRNYKQMSTEELVPIVQMQMDQLKGMGVDVGKFLAANPILDGEVIDE